MNTIIHIWDTLVKSNTFNFLVMLAILYWIVKKFDIAGSLENFKSSIINSIKKADEEKETAKNILLSAEKSVENLDSEISQKLKNAKKHAQDVARSVISQTENKIQQIESNVTKIIETEEKKISSSLTSKTAAASSELAKKHIISVLKEHPEMHEKFINQSIEELG